LSFYIYNKKLKSYKNTGNIIVTFQFLIVDIERQILLSLTFWAKFSPKYSPIHADVELN